MGAAIIPLEEGRGKLYLQAQDTKTDTPRVLYLTGDLWRVLEAWKRRCDEKWPSCPWICYRGGIRLQSLKHSWCQVCERVGLGRMVKNPVTKTRVWEGKIPHDFRRTAIRLSGYFLEQMGTISGTVAELQEVESVAAVG